MELLRKKHEEYLKIVQKKRDLFSYGKDIREHLAIPGAYWSVTAFYLLKMEMTEAERQELVDFVMSCQNKDHGFGGSPGHDSNVTCTLYALILLMLFGRFDKIDKDQIRKFVMSLYVETEGAFKGDFYGEIDGRFCYSAIYILKLIGAEIPEKTFEFFLKCFNYDGGFGGRPDAESHAAYTFCAVAALSILNRVKDFDIEKLTRFLAIRQTSQGGFNGRPEKLPDVCYSWWVLASIGAYESLEIIDVTMLEKYILDCQDPDDGGFSDRPGNGNDVFHTFFALAALSLIDHKKYGLELVDPVYAIPKSLVDKFIDKK